MTLVAGAKLGPYEITGAVGAGGMGEVYRARDTRLNRVVAIKVLPAHLADKPDLRERFEREARTVASLNHPHICVLHDIGQQDGTDYLVLEYLEGETLGQRLTKGPLPLDQVLQYAIEIVDALDKAHRKGITHRDLKPGNIMLTKSGAKLLDFGLAKLRQETAPANVSLSKLPTANDPVTEAGTILGTLQYMAPEQLEGKEADARTDIFPFGVVVYEMATRKKAFEGKSQASVISAIMSSDPQPMSSLQPMTPPALERVVKRCVAKDPDERWQSARDVCQELKWIAEGGSQTALAATAAAKGAHALGRRTLVLGLCVLALGGVIGGFAIWNLKPSPPQPVSHLMITLPPGDRLAGLDQLALTLSPDGSHLAYVAIRGGNQQIYLRAMDSLEANPVPGTEGAVNPFFSRDGQWLGFFAGGKLKKVSVKGGAVLTLADAALPHGAAWGSQGRIVFAPLPAGPLDQVSEAGGTPQPLTRLDKGDTIHGWPEFLPNGEALLFVTSSNNVLWSNSQVQVAVHSIRTGERQNLVPGTHPTYAPSGHLLYGQGGTLMAAPFDSQRLTLTGPAVPVVENVLQSSTTGAAQYSISATGSLVYALGGVQSAQSRMVWVNRQGAEQALPAPARAYRFPRISPDGQRVAATIDEAESDIWLYDLRRENLTRWTFEGGINLLGAWSPDGKRIAFQSDREGPVNLFWQLADGGGRERLATSQYPQAPNSWSPEGQALAFIEINPTTGYDIWVLRLSDRKAQPFLQTRFLESAPQFSPDGHWLAYVSNESRHFEIYVQPYPGPGGKWQISTDGGTEPTWNRNGRELFYRQGNKMMAVEVTTQPSFSAGKPKMLFEGPYLPTAATFPNYDVSSDGQRFLMLQANEQAQAPTQINVVLNWFEELKQKVPTGKR